MTQQSVGLEGQASAEGGIRTGDAGVADIQLGVDTASEDPLGGLQVLDRRTAEIIAGMARAMYPHDRLPDLYYQRISAALDVKAAADEELRSLLTEGVGFLATTTGKRPEEFAGLPESEQVPALKRLERTPFFKAVASEVVVNLYSQHDVWPYFGYEGPSNDLGGYLHRGYDDLDWVSDAPDHRGQEVPTDDGTAVETGIDTGVRHDGKVPA